MIRATLCPRLVGVSKNSRSIYSVLTRTLTGLLRSLAPVQAECGRTIARFLASRRVLLRSGYDLSYFLGSSGVGAENLVALSLRLLAGASLNHLARLEVMAGYPNDLSWVRWIMERCQLENWSSDYHETEVANRTSNEDVTTALMCLGRFCAERGASGTAAAHPR